MDHIAIMDPQKGLISKILSGEKKIESRWYQTRRAPWNLIKKGETIYFKDSGKPITAKAIVSRVLQFEFLDIKGVEEVVKKYGDAIALVNKNPGTWGKLPKYCLLAFLKDPQLIAPFNIDKKGFGSGVAWISIEKVSTIKV
jgi:ASC-1-like (ASCH) protein